MAKAQTAVLEATLVGVVSKRTVKLARAMELTAEKLVPVVKAAAALAATAAPPWALSTLVRNPSRCVSTSCRAVLALLVLVA